MLWFFGSDANGPSKWFVTGSSEPSIHRTKGASPGARSIAAPRPDASDTMRMWLTIGFISVAIATASSTLVASARIRRVVWTTGSPSSLVSRARPPWMTTATPFALMPLTAPMKPGHETDA